MNEIEQLVRKLEEYNRAYRSGSPIVSDAVYDDLVEKLRKLDPENSFLTTVEPEKITGRAEIRHPSPMLSLQKAYTRQQLERFLSRVEKEAKQIGLKQVLFKITPKLDGLAGRDDGETLASRGNGHAGYDISDAFKKGVVAVGQRGQGLGEIVVVKSYFDMHLANKFEHPRNMVVGIISSDVLNENAKTALTEEQVCFVPYSQLESWKGTAEEILENIDAISEKLINETDYPMDGVVVEVTDDNLKRHMGATTHHCRWQIAVKKKGQTAETTVKAVKWQVGRTGNVTPVLEVNPVSLSGATIKRVTAHHAGMVHNLSIGPGARIEIIRSGEVIPKIEKVVTPSETVTLPETCPACDSELIWKNDFLRCEHISCPAQKKQRLVHWFRTLGTADWFGVKTIDKLVSNGFDNLEKIYAMKTQDFESLGFGPVQSGNLSEALLTSRNKTVEDWRFLAAFGIPDLGIGDSRKLLKHYPIEKLLDVEQKSVAEINGFGDITSLSITSGLEKMKDTIRHMLNLGFVLEKTKSTSGKKEPASAISGKAIVFTGKMVRGDRSYMQEQARQLGATVQTSINKKTDLLICGESVGAVKLEKATALGVKILSEQDYSNLIGNEHQDEK
ncbi:MAG: DNA ligase [Desulfobacteraceae bacterium]|nr:DNA ligase [Desulfobacteraceae bacterium]